MCCVVWCIVMPRAFCCHMGVKLVSCSLSILFHTLCLLCRIYVYVYDVDLMYSCRLSSFYSIHAAKSVRRTRREVGSITCIVGGANQRQPERIPPRDPCTLVGSAGYFLCRKQPVQQFCTETQPRFFQQVGASIMVHAGWRGRRTTNMSS